MDKLRKREMDKLSMQSEDGVKSNIEKIKELFPDTVTEVLRDGKVEYKVDFVALKQKLSSDLVKNGEGCYRFTWAGMREAERLANLAITDTLRPNRKDSVDFDNTQNLYIEGDNLDVLKLLKKTYRGKVKMIYIDPPYNTKKNSLIYKDNFVQSKEDYEEAANLQDENMVSNLEKNGRFHTNWLNMIYPRLMVARDLLAEDGVIFISIDDNEVENLKKICDDVFGVNNLVTRFVWHNNKKGRPMDKIIKGTCEYVLMAAKKVKNLCVDTEKVEKDIKKYKLQDDISFYKKGYPLHNGNQHANIDYNSSMCYSIYYNLYDNHPVILDEVVESKGGHKHLQISKKGKELLKKGYIRIVPKTNDKYKNQRVWRWGVEKFMNKYKTELMLVEENNGYYFYQKERLNKEGLREQKFTNYIDIPTQRGKKEINELFNNRIVFKSPKPVDLIKHFLLTVSDKDFTVLDFFSGSATTAHAVMQLNAEDGGHRKFIMVQLPEKCGKDTVAFKEGYKTICEIGKERIRRAGKKILKENPSSRGSLDVGFRVLKLDSSNMKDVYYTPELTKQEQLKHHVDTVKKMRTSLDLLFQVMLEHRNLLSSKVEETKICGKTVFKVDGNNLICCFDKGISTELLEKIVDLNPKHVVLRESSFIDDKTMFYCDQLFNTSGNKVCQVI